MKNLAHIFLSVSLMLLMGTCAFAQSNKGPKAFVMTDVEMADGDTLILTYGCPGYKDSPFTADEQKLVDENIESIMTTPILKALGVQEHRDHVKWDLKNAMITEYGARHLFYRNFFANTGDYLKKIGTSSKVRTVVFKAMVKVVCDLCMLYPKDFQQMVLEELGAVKEFLSEADEHEFHCERDIMIVDGSPISDEFAQSIFGFVLRRVACDGLTVNEILSYTDKMIEAVKGVKNESNPEYYSARTINGEITAYVGADSTFIQSELVDKQYFPFPERFYYTPATMIVCTKDVDNTYYMVTSGYLGSGGFTVFTDSDELYLNRSCLIDRNCEIIYGEE